MVAYHTWAISRVGFAWYCCSTVLMAVGDWAKVWASSWARFEQVDATACVLVMGGREGCGGGMPGEVEEVRGDAAGAEDIGALTGPSSNVLPTLR
jgi:hypothetical protein